MPGPSAHIDNRPPRQLDMPGQLIGGVLGQTGVEDFWLRLLKEEKPEQPN
jgi:hypothetical protein